jgi:hypothetical protein
MLEVQRLSMVDKISGAFPEIHQHLELTLAHSHRIT